MSRAGTRGITTQGLGQGEEVRKGRPAIPLAVGVCGEGDRAPDGAAQQYFSLSISLLWEKKNANSAAANFAQVHLNELPTSNQPTGRKA